MSVLPALPVIDTAPTSKQLEAFCTALRPRIAGDLRTDTMSRALYATDASMYKIKPVAVLIPKHVSDVQAALEEAYEHHIPVLPRGGGSSLAGQAVGPALVIDFTKHLNRIVEIHAEDRWARVEPGVVLDDLNAAAAEHGLMVGPDPASSSRATLGGMLANNSTGTHSLRYGNFIHHTLSAEAFLADGTPVAFGPLDHKGWQAHMRKDGLEGTIYRSLDALLTQRGDIIRRDTPSHWRRNNGYRLEHLLDADERNLAALMCGSEGTLAVITEITCRLVPKPKHTALGIAHYETRDDALRSVTTVLETEPAAVELFDGVAIERTRETPGYSHRLTFIDGEPGGVLITEYYGDSEDELNGKLDALEQKLEEAGEGYSVVRVIDPAAVKNVWSIRKEGLGLIMGVKGDYKPWAFIEDASVPVENLADYIHDLSRFIDATDTRAAYYAHASAGCLHVRPFINTKDAAEVKKMRDIAVGSMELVDKYGGSISSEHGDGIVRGWLNQRFLGEALYETYRETKRLFDPKHILNPGKIVDGPPMTENLRMGPDYRPRSFMTKMDFSEEGSFMAALEKCNGNGACRKLHSGTMCPSFMATREEQDSTRGRANALRAALAGEIPREELTGTRMQEVMDLCVQCKACKTECPSNVDMAKMKTEWLNEFWKHERMPMRTRLFANQPRLAQYIAGTPVASVVNWFNGQPLVRGMMERTLGISAERDLPPFARQTFKQWFTRQSNGSPETNGTHGGGPPVVLFADTFNNFHTPEVSRAATEFLQRTGHTVQVPTGNLCCGRTLLSKGKIDEAQLSALYVVEALYPYAEQGTPIVGLEPSCILTLRDEFLALLPGEPRAEAVAEVTMTFEEFVARRADDGAFEDVRWSGTSGRVMLHGHCHQKALIGTAATERALALPGYAVEAVDAGCCGMAGAFGYEAEHVEVSKQMAELRLAPAVRATAPDTLIAAPGFSCRSQVKDTTERTARHPAQILRDSLA